MVVVVVTTTVVVVATATIVMLAEVAVAEVGEVETPIPVYVLEEQPKKKPCLKTLLKKHDTR